MENIETIFIEMKQLHLEIINHFNYTIFNSMNWFVKNLKILW